MKSKDFIKLLKKIDPTGETHICGFGGAIIDAYPVEGYYDGSYSYMDDGVYVLTKKNMKIEVITYDIDSIIDRYSGDMGKLRKYIRLDNGDIDKMWETIEYKAKEYRDLEDKFVKEFTFEILQKYQQGFQVAQSIKDKIGQYHVMWWHDIDSKQLYRITSIGKTNNLNQGQCGAIIKSGFFIPVQEGEIYVWKLNLNKNN
jgi:hypothetical protein